MAIRVAINGFGRIGRLVFRVLQERGGYEVVAINDLAPASSLAHLLKYDTVHGRYPGTVVAGEGAITVDGKEVKVCSERDPAHLPWAEYAIDFVVESTGFFATQELCM
jgi:glyceraldehyde 3-phosphate dehydrogenase